MILIQKRRIYGPNTVKWRPVIGYAWLEKINIEKCEEIRG